MIPLGFALAYFEPIDWAVMKRARLNAERQARLEAHRRACVEGTLARGVGAAPRAGVDKAPMLNLAPATAQDLGSCLPLLLPEMSARHNPWGEGPDAASALTSAPAGSPGGFGSRGATFREAA